MAGVGAPLMVAWELTGEGNEKEKEKEKERRGKGGRHGEGQLGGRRPWRGFARGRRHG
jgi:hypothetical protein